MLVVCPITLHLNLIYFVFLKPEISTPIRKQIMMYAYAKSHA